MTDDEHLQRLRETLKEHPHGLSVTEAAKAINLNRNSTARYLDVLHSKGLADVRRLGPAKLYLPAHRTPLHALLDHSSDAIILYNDDEVLRANQRGEHLFTRDKGLAGIRLATTRQLREGLAGNEIKTETSIDGRTFRVRILPTRLEDEQPAATLIAEDVTQERERQAELAVYKRAMDVSAGAITIADAQRPDMPLIYCNDAFLELTGYARDEMLGKNCRFLQADDRDQAALQEIRDALRHGEECTVTLRNYTKRGKRFKNLLTLTPVRDQQGTLTHYVGVQREL